MEGTQAINQGIYNRMANDSTLTSLLSTYNGAPAIFTVATIPTDANFPLITANEDFTNVPFDTKDTGGREVTRYVRVFTEATGSRVLLDTIAERVRFLFHKKHHEVAFDGYQPIIINVVGPEFLATDERIYGVEFEIRFVFQNLKC